MCQNYRQGVWLKWAWVMMFLYKLIMLPVDVEHGNRSNKRDLPENKSNFSTRCWLQNRYRTAWLVKNLSQQKKTGRVWITSIALSWNTLASKISSQARMTSKSTKLDQ
mmetsp:Transcript_13477/g.32837  ORF Transcript_13477/g.32837 Transcript_13477/m.32837 type:complete len:108 (-) Transcript_13477:165-488(-)